MLENLYDVTKMDFIVRRHGDAKGGNIMLVTFEFQEGFKSNAKEVHSRIYVDDMAVVGGMMQMYSSRYQTKQESCGNKHLLTFWLNIDHVTSRDIT